MQKQPKLTDPAHDAIGNGTESHADLARQLEMRGYTIEMNSDDNGHSEVHFAGVHVGDIRGDSEATVTSLCDEDEENGSVIAKGNKTDSESQHYAVAKINGDIYYWNSYVCDWCSIPSEWISGIVWA